VTPTGHVTGVATVAPQRADSAPELLEPGDHRPRRQRARIEDIIRRLIRPAKANRCGRLRHANASEVVRTLTTAACQRCRRQQDAADERTNSVLIAGDKAAALGGRW
jgi:hypothetical protein